jgi:uncharacterized repeat protein (TIGR03803 family)
MLFVITMALPFWDKRAMREKNWWKSCKFYDWVMAGASVILVLGLSARADAQVETVLHAFNRLDGANPVAGLISNAAGNLYGTTAYGGADNWGTVFELTPNAGGWQETVLHSFTNADGATPMAGLTMDAAGNLYGTTFQGGNLNYCSGFGCGEVFQLAPSSSSTWQLNVLYTFTRGRDGGVPLAGVILDSAGNIYGTTRDGGSNNTCAEFNSGCGVVFKLSQSSAGVWKETVIHNFTGGWDGANPLSGLMIDAANNVYGMTNVGGLVTTECRYGCGVVYRLAPASNGGWTPTVLHTFTGGGDGSFPYAVLIHDSAGNLYGTTAQGGNSNCEPYNPSGCGVVFKLSPTSSGEWKETVLHAFIGGFKDGALPLAGVVFDSSGNLYGTTYNGGRGCIGYGCGVVFEMKPTSGGKWKGVFLTTFTGGFEGGNPYSALILDSAGNLYGTAAIGGTSWGLVFEITP